MSETPEEDKDTGKESRYLRKTKAIIRRTAKLQEQAKDLHTPVKPRKKDKDKK